MQEVVVTRQLQDEHERESNCKRITKTFPTERERNCKHMTFLFSQQSTIGKKLKNEVQWNTSTLTHSYSYKIHTNWYSNNFLKKISTLTEITVAKPQTCCLHS